MNTPEPQNKSNDLLRRAEILKHKISNQQSDDKLLSTENYGLAVRIITTANTYVDLVKRKVLQPLINFMPGLKSWAYRLKNLWLWFCYPSENIFKATFRLLYGLFAGLKLRFLGSSNNHIVTLPPGNFSRRRAAIFVFLVFLLVAWPFQVPFFRDISYALIYEPPYDLTRMSINLAFHGGKFRSEKLYLNGKNEINPEENIWSISGCERKTECPPEDAVYFRIKPSLIHWLWSLAVNHQPFIADDVAGVVPNTPSECEVKSYGVRWRLMRWLQAYPIALNIKCRYEIR